MKKNKYDIKLNDGVDVMIKEMGGRINRYYERQGGWTGYVRKSGGM